jgi:hypothetical protein
MLVVFCGGVDHSDVILLKLMHCCEYYLMGFKSVLRYQNFCVAFFASTFLGVFFSSQGNGLFWPESLAHYQRNIQ